MEQEEKKNVRDRFLPCLFSRLTDDDPQSQKENPLQLFTSENIRQDIMRNLETLLNMPSHLPDDALTEYPYTQRSVLGMGLPSFCGKTADAATLEKLRKDIVSQIRNFEPRIDPETLKVEFDDNAHIAQELIMKISGTIRLHPLDEEIVFISEMNFETGAINVKRN